jgi:hypothetical protein
MNKRTNENKLRAKIQEKLSKMKEHSNSIQTSVFQTQNDEPCFQEVAQIDTDLFVKRMREKDF